MRNVCEEEDEKTQEIEESGPNTTLMTIDDMEPEEKQTSVTEPSAPPESSKDAKIEKSKEG